MISPEERAALDRGDFRAALEAYEKNRVEGPYVDMRPRKRKRIVMPAKRTASGQARTGTKLSPEDIREIRKSQASSGEVASLYSVSRSLVTRIRNYESYKWVS